MRWGGTVTSVGKNRSAYKVLVRKSEGKMHLKRRMTTRIILKFVLKMEDIRVTHDRNQWPDFVHASMKLRCL